MHFDWRATVNILYALLKLAYMNIQLYIITLLLPRALRPADERRPSDERGRISENVQI